MFKKESTYLRRDDDDFEVALAAMQHLRKMFLTLPFDQFVKVKKLWQSLPDDAAVRHYLMRLDARLDFGMDSFRYFMQYLADAKTAEVADRYAWHDVHTDFRGRCEIRRADKALGYAMGFHCLEEDLGVESFGYEADPGYVEETISTALGEVTIAGCKNAKGRYHGYCQIEQADGVLQECFFDDGKILARRLCYANGMSEDVRDNATIAVDVFADRTAYKATENADGTVEINEIPISRAVARAIFDTLSTYSLEMECEYERHYPYDDETHYEIERARCVPGVNMALLKGGKLWGAVLKTNGHGILPPDCDKYALRDSWKVYTVRLDDTVVQGDLKISLKKQSQ